MNADCALVNGGAIRESIPVGDITLKAINSVQPFGNSLYIMKTSGKNILKVIEDNTATVPELEGGFPQVSGIEYTLDTRKEYVSGEINRVTITSINGKPFDENKIYTVATTDFVANGGDKYSAFVNSEYVDLGITTDSVLAGYIRNSLGGKVGEKYAKPQGRITVISSSSDSSSSSESTTNTTSTSAKSPVPIIGIAAGLVASILFTGNRFNKSRR